MCAERYGLRNALSRVNVCHSIDTTPEGVSVSLSKRNVDKQKKEKKKKYMFKDEKATGEKSQPSWQQKMVQTESINETIYTLKNKAISYNSIQRTREVKSTRCLQ